VGSVLVTPRALRALAATLVPAAVVAAPRGEHTDGMDLTSPAARRLGALGFGAAVPGVLLACVLGFGNHRTAHKTSSDDIGPAPAPSVSSTQVGGGVLLQSDPPIVSDFQTDSTSGYANGLPSVDLFDCQPVLTKPKGGGKAVMVKPAKCKSRPKAK